MISRLVAALAIASAVSRASGFCCFWGGCLNCSSRAVADYCAASAENCGRCGHGAAVWCPDLGGPPPAGGVTPHPEPVWADEFDGDSVDAGKWGYTVGPARTNDEAEYYTQGSNSLVYNGTLKIVSKCQKYGGRSYTSARMKSLQSWGPGHRIEVRARLPLGKGTWPAIWMLPSSEAYGGWPRSGEIDIMETVGCEGARTLHGTVHTELFNHMLNTQKTGSVSLPSPESWHVFSVLWTDGEIAWFLDGERYYDYKRTTEGYKAWPFDKDFYLILNVAVGGSWGGYCLGGRAPSCSSRDEFGEEQVMEVDYARVFIHSKM